MSEENELGNLDSDESDYSIDFEDIEFEEISPRTANAHQTLLLQIREAHAPKQFPAQARSELKAPLESSVRSRRSKGWYPTEHYDANSLLRRGSAGERTLVAPTETSKHTKLSVAEQRRFPVNKAPSEVNTELPGSGSEGDVLMPLPGRRRSAPRLPPSQVPLLGHNLTAAGSTWTSL